MPIVGRSNRICSSFRRGRSRSLDSVSLAPSGPAKRCFAANGDRFVLYLADGDPSSAGEERVIFLELREALIWLNEPSEQPGSFWT